MSNFSLRQLFGQFAVYGVSDALIKLLGFVTVVVYTHIFTPADYGVISIVGAFAGLLSIVGGLGISSAVHREYFAATEARRLVVVSTGYWGVLGWSGVVACIGVALAPLMTRLTFGSFEYWGLVALAVIGTPVFQGVAFCQDVIRLHFRPWRFTTVAFFNQAAQVVFGIILVVAFGFGLYGLFSGILIGAAATLIFGTIGITSELRLKFSWAEFCRFARYGAPLVLGGLAFPAFTFADRLILEHFRGPAAVGHLAVALSVAQGMGFISSSFGKAWNVMAWKFRNQHTEYRRVFADVLLYLVAVFAVVAVGIAAFAHEIIGILAPPVFADAAIAVAPLTVYMLANVSIQVTAIGISISGRTRYLTVVIWAAVGGNVVLDIALIPIWGIFGAAIATAVAETLMTVAIAAISQRLHPLPYDYRRLVGCMTLLVVFLGISYQLHTGWTFEAIASKIALVGVFVGALFATSVVSWKQLEQTAALLSGTEFVVAAPAKQDI